MFDQERRHHHPDTVVHHAGVPELAHSGIDDGVAGPAALPGDQGLVVALPGEGVEGRLQVALGEIGDVEQQVAAEFAPAEFAEELVDIARELRAFGGGKARGVPDLARAELAESQMRRQSRGAGAVGPVAIAGVSGDAVVEEGPEPRLGRGLAGLPALPQAGRPIGSRRLKLPVAE